MRNLAPQHDAIGIYFPKNPQASTYFRSVLDHFEKLEMHWQDRYTPRYEFWRPYVTDTPKTLHVTAPLFNQGNLRFSDVVRQLPFNQPDCPCDIV